MEVDLLVGWHAFTKGEVVTIPPPAWASLGSNGSASSWSLFLRFFWIYGPSTPLLRPVSDTPSGQRFGLASCAAADTPSIFVTHSGELLIEADGSVWKTQSLAILPNQWCRLWIMFSVEHGLAAWVQNSDDNRPSRFSCTLQDGSCSAGWSAHLARAKGVSLAAWCTKSSPALRVGTAPRSNGFIGIITNIRVSLQPFVEPLAAEHSALSWPGLPAPRNLKLGPQDVEPQTQPIVSVESLLSWVPSHSFTAAPWISKKLPTSRGLNIVTHDMRGGYLADSWDCTTESSECDYSFQRWDLCDVFVYFSHFRVTIPPKSWIWSAHKQGVRILGTLIFEWHEGELDLLYLLDNRDLAVKKLTEIACFFGFDGYLLNFEAPIPATRLADAISFVSQLKDALRDSLGDCAFLMWYDALSAVDGQVRWQNELHEAHTLPFLQQSDAVFLNYQWSESHLQRSLQLMLARDIEPYRVCVGVDVHGRGTPFGGGFSTQKAVSYIREIHPQFSVALFAPAWTVEVQAPLWPHRSRWQRVIEPTFWATSEPSASSPFLDLIAMASNNGWDCTPADGDTWKALPLIEGAYPVPEEHNLTGSLICPVSDSAAVVRASFRQCQRRKRFPLRPGFSCLWAELWVRGTPPCSDDPYRWSLVLHTPHGAQVLFDTGPSVASESWKQLYTVVSLPTLAPNCEIEWVEEGSDAEHWRGNFGTVFSNRCLLQTANTNAVHTDTTGCHVNQLPWVTSFGTGAALRGIFRNGCCLKKLSSPVQSPLLIDAIPSAAMLPLSACYPDDSAPAFMGGASLCIETRPHQLVLPLCTVSPDIWCQLQYIKLVVRTKVHGPAPDWCLKLRPVDSSGNEDFVLSPQTPTSTGANIMYHKKSETEAEDWVAHTWHVQTPVSAASAAISLCFCLAGSPNTSLFYIGLLQLGDKPFGSQAPLSSVVSGVSVDWICPTPESLLTAEEFADVLLSWRVLKPQRLSFLDVDVVPRGAAMPEWQGRTSAHWGRLLLTRIPFNSRFVLHFVDHLYESYPPIDL